MPQKQLRVEVVCNGCGETIKEVEEGMVKNENIVHKCDGFFKSAEVKIELPNIAIRSNPEIIEE